MTRHVKPAREVRLGEAVRFGTTENFALVTDTGRGRFDEAVIGTADAANVVSPDYEVEVSQHSAGCTCRHT
jgi:hypothetical protein